PDGFGWKSDARGLHARPFTVLRPQGRPALGDAPGPTDDDIQKRLSLPPRGLFPTGDVIVVLGGASVTGALLVDPRQMDAREPITTDAAVNDALAAVGAESM